MSKIMLKHPFFPLFTTVILSSLTLPVAAESALQLYGTLDTGISYTKQSGDARHRGLINGGQTDSIWGLQGSEDLGNGAHALFQLESSIDLLSGQLEEDALFDQSARLGLQHEGWGTLYLGRQNPVSQQFNEEVELAGWKDFGLGALMRNSDNYQQDQSIQYYTPSWAGWQAGLGYQAADWDKSSLTDQPERFNSALRFEGESLYAAISYDQHLQSRHPYTPKHAKALQVSAKYDFDAFTLAAAWARQKNGFVGLNGGEQAAEYWEVDALEGYGAPEFLQGGKVDSVFVGAALPLGQGELIAQWSLAKPNWHWEETQKKARKVQVYSLGYVYDLSARTQLYAFGAYGKNYHLDQVFDASNSSSRRAAIGLTHHF